MIVTIHQPEHLPWLGFFHKMALADCYVFLDCAQYRHRYFQNRNLVLGADGPVWVNVPVRKLAHRYGPIAQVRIDNSRAWQHTYWGTIEHNYRRHPFFDLYAPALRPIVEAPHDTLGDMNYALIDFIRSALGIATPTVRASELGVYGAKTAIIHAICRELNASVYLSGPSGREYLEEGVFRRDGIDVWYHSFEHPLYPQRGRVAFTERLSALDLLMNCGPASAEILGVSSRDREIAKYLLGSVA